MEKSACSEVKVKNPWSGFKELRAYHLGWVIYTDIQVTQDDDQIGNEESHSVSDAEAYDKQRVFHEVGGSINIQHEP